MSIAIGIDLGTSTSEITAVIDGKPTPIRDPNSKTPVVPSIVAVNNKGDLLVGSDAKKWVDRPGMGVREVKRFMGEDEVITLGGKEYRPEEISALILRKLKQNAEIALGQPVEQAVITVPANFSDAARTATIAAAEIAGLKVLRLINEPTAASIAYGVDNVQKEEYILVYDFGGGTLDITVLEMMEGVLDVRASDGERHLGGKDLDDALTDLVLRKWSQSIGSSVNLGEEDRIRLKAAIEEAKKELSAASSTSIFIENFAVLNGIPHDLEVDVTRPEFDATIAPLLDRSSQCVLRALEKAKVSKDQIQRIILVGGTTYVPAVRARLEEVMGKPVALGNVDPDLAVSQGAALMAEILSGQSPEVKGITVSDVARFGLGIEVLTVVGNQPMLIYEPLIHPNQKIPFAVKKQYSLVHPDQREVEIRVLQDPTGKAQIPEEAQDIGIKGAITGIPPALYGSPHPIEISFAYNADGQVVLRAEIPGIGKSCEIRYDQSGKRMSQEQIEQSKARIEQAFQESPIYGEFSDLIRRAENALAKAAGKEIEGELRSALLALKQAVKSNDRSAAKEAEEALLDVLFRLEIGS